MEEQQAYDLALSLLSDQALSIEMIRKYGLHAPVNALTLSNVNKEHVICISEDLLEDLYTIHTHTNNTNQEVPFFLYGEERKDGSIYLDTIIIGEAKSSLNADFSTLKSHLITYFNFINANINSLNNTQILCHGHTHGRGMYADTFSLADMGAYIMMDDIHKYTREKKVQTIGCVYNSKGDFNFVFYDKENKGFYRFPSVYIEHKDGKKTPLPAYQKGTYKFVNVR